MRSIGKSFLFTVAIMVLSLGVFPVVAQMQIAPVDQGTCGQLGIFCTGNDDVNTANQVIRQIVNGFLALVAVGAAIFIVIGGVRYITARGDEQEVEKAKATILYAIIGLIVIGLSAAIANFIIGAVGGGGGGGGGAGGGGGGGNGVGIF